MSKYYRPIKNNKIKQATKPIKDTNDINFMMRYLIQQIERAPTEIKQRQARRNWMLIFLGINTNFRVEDLVQLKVEDVERGFFSVRENKTKKVQNYPINKNLFEDIKKYVSDNELSSGDYLFATQKKLGLMPMTRQQVDRILKNVADKTNLKQKFSAHSMRKTWAYQKYKSGTPLLTISKMLNHYDIQETLLYICWGDEDIDKERESTYFGAIHRK